MNEIVSYIDPEIAILVPVLYAVGCGLKRSEFIPDKYIPIIIGIAGVVMACLYILAKDGLSPDSMFASICQGILCAAASVYFNQVYKQMRK